MPQLITFGNELIRINPARNSIEYSTSRGLSWVTRCSGSAYGTFKDLLPYNGKLFALTDKGLYYSTTKGLSWVGKNTGSTPRTFVAIQDAGREMLAQTFDGHIYYSTSEGLSWVRRR